MTAPPPDDAAALEGFPTQTLDVDTQLFRIHRSARRVEYYSNRGDGRFDPPPSSREDFGTCYLGETPMCAFLETLGRLRVVPDYLVAERSLTTLTVSKPLHIADISDPRVLGRYGIIGDLSAGSDYQVPQLWAAALRAAGFDGIRYVARHDPSFAEASIALFGPAGGTGDLLVPVKPDPQAIPDDLIAEAAGRFEVYVIPTAAIL